MVTIIIILLLSYHPESKTGNFFLIRKNYALLAIMQEICQCILTDSKIIDWKHSEDKTMRKLGEKLVLKDFEFKNLLPLRTHIKSLCKDIPRVEFYDNIDFNVNN